MQTTTPDTRRSEPETLSTGEQRVLQALEDLKQALRSTDGALGFERALVRELDRIETKVREAGQTSPRSIADELRVQAHLAAMDARDRLHLIEPFLKNALAKARDEKLPAARLQIALGKMELQDRIAAQRKQAEQELREARDATADAIAALGERVAALVRELLPHRAP